MIRVIRRKNPVNKELLKSLIIKKIEFGDGYLTYEVYLKSDKNNLIGKFELWDNVNYLNQAFVKNEFQKQGVATYIYDYIERDLNRKLIPHRSLTLSGKAFWKNRLKNPTDL